jgi:hypothetical protein
MYGEVIPALITTQSALDTKASVDVGRFAFAAKLRFWVTFSAGTSAGAVKIESADDPNFAGEWATEATVTWSIANKQLSALVEGPFNALRVRISTAIVGGTVSISAATAR